MSQNIQDDLKRLGAGALAGHSKENQMLNALIDSVPEMDADMFGRMAEEFLNVKSVFELDKMFQAESLEDYLGEVITITNVHRAPSDYEDGAKDYFILDIIHEDQGRKTTITTGAIKVLMQVAAAYRIGGLPLTVVPKQAGKKTKRGFTPLELEIWKEQIQKNKEVVVPFERPDEEDLPF